MNVVHVVADSGPGDLAFTEMFSALLGHLPQDEHWLVKSTPVGSFDTIGTGFVVAQLGLQCLELRAPNTIIYANCAPRRDITKARRNNEGEGFLYGVLSTGVPILVVNSGHSLSFVREELSELWSVKVKRGGSQFRSRDLFPPIVGRVAQGQIDFLHRQLDPLQVILPPPEGVIGYIDSFGNIKTTFRQGDPKIEALTRGQALRIRINGTVLPARVAKASFNVKPSEIAFAPGSSGHDQRFWEIFRRGESAWEAFQKPHVGSIVEILE